MSRGIISRPSSLALALLCWAASPGCSQADDQRVRNLLAMGGTQIRLQLEDGPRTVESAGGALLLPDQGRAICRLEVSGTAALEFGLSGGPGRVEVEVGAFSPAGGEVTRLSPIAAFDLDGAAGVYERLDLPAANGEVLVVAFAFTANEQGAACVVDRLVLREAAVPPLPSIIFISVDTFSAGHMSLYGYERETTPSLDMLAEESVTFAQASSNATWTTPSYVSQFSGLFPDACHSGDSKLWEWAIPDDRWTLAEMLRARGYLTAAFVDNLNVSSRYGLAQGFELFDMSAAEITITETNGGIRHLLPKAEAWLEGRQDQPFFLFLQAVDLHAPFVPPEEYVGHFDPADGVFDPEATLPVEAPSEFSYPHTDGCVPYYVAEYGEQFAKGDDRMYTAPLISAYDDQILALDEALGGFLDRLRGNGLFDDLIVIVSADHGETMIEHDTYFQHVNHYQENLRVPLIVKLPQGEGAGRWVDQQVQLVDLYPTVAELVGLDVGRRSLHGRSLVPLLRGRAGLSAPVLAEAGMGHSSSISWEGWKLVESFPGKLMYSRQMSHIRTRRQMEERYPALKGRVFGTINWDQNVPLEDPEAVLAEVEVFATDLSPYYELYDLVNDPGETINLVDSEPERMQEMLELLRDRSALTLEAASRVPPSPPGDQEPLTDAQRAELKKLGYAGD